MHVYVRITPIQIIFYENKASKFKLVILFICYIIHNRAQYCVNKFMRVDFTIYRCTIFQLEPESYEIREGTWSSGDH